VPATDPHPDADQALYVDDHGPAFTPPWLDDPEEAVTQAAPAQQAAAYQQATDARQGRKGLIAQLEAGEADAHELAGLRANERPPGYRPGEEGGVVSGG
jgi:hypothetical protein